jgi:hypothetical protein
VVLFGGLVMILLGLTVFDSAAASNVAKIAAVACATFICSSMVYNMRRSGSYSEGEDAHAAGAEEIAVDRKLSKKSVSTIASTTSSTVIYHAPSNSLERVSVVGSGDVEQGLPEPLRS